MEKTTFLKTISGILDPWQGRIVFLGKQLNRPASHQQRSSRNFNYDALRRRHINPHQVVKSGMIQVPQGNLLFPELTVDETLKVAGGVLGGKQKTRETRDFAETLFPILAERQNQKIKSLSGGERQMVAIGAGLMGRPKLLILDEPTLGLSPKIRLDLFSAIETIKKTGVSILIVEQDIEFLLNLVDTLYMFDHGSISSPIEQQNMPDHENIMNLYFGNATL